MAESADGAYKTELVWRRKPFRDLRDLELATFRWVSWWNSKRLRRSLGYGTPERTETEYYANQAAQAAVVPEKLRTLDHGRPWSDDQFASTRLSSNRDMSR